MKTFKDLKFEDHKVTSSFSTQAVIEFDNKYGVSVITGDRAYSSEKNPYEVAILYKDQITYNTHITDNVIGYCDEEKVTEIMKQVQELEK